jgi:hypothetical protein
MSFVDSLLNFGSSLLTGGGLGGNILRTAVTGLALNRLTQSTNKSSDSARTAPEDQGVNVQTTASTENKIPVLYGRAVTGGQLFDVRMSNNNNTMHYCYVLSERTGDLLSTGLASEYTFNNIYWSGYKMNFQSDGITLASLEDLQGNLRTNWADNIEVYCYAGNSASGTVPAGYTGAAPPAWTVVPGWTASWQMTDLIFAVVRVNYVRAFNLTGIGTMTFDVSNSMSQPGDVLYDLSTNTRYGSGIAPADIKGF